MGEALAGKGFRRMEEGDGSPDATATGGRKVAREGIVMFARDSFARRWPKDESGWPAGGLLALPPYGRIMRKSQGE